MRVKYADVVFELEYECREADRLFARYETDEPVDERVVITEEDLTRTFIKICDYRFRKHPGWKKNEENLVFDATHEKMCPLLLKHNVLTFHGAGVEVDGRGYAFLAPHYTGKTTHVRYWQEYFGERAALIDEDKFFVKVSDDEIYIYGSGWASGSKPGMVDGVPLAAVVGIARGDENEIERADVTEAVRLVMRHSYRPEDPLQMMHRFGIADSLVKRIPFASLKCVKSISSVPVAYEYLKGAE